MEQHAEVKSEVTQIQKPFSSKKIKRYKKLDTEIKVHEILAAPDYLYLSSTEFIQHFTNMITADEIFDLYEYHKNYIKVMGYANRGLFDTILNYFRQKNDDLVIATTPLHHTSWRNVIEKHVKTENIHIIDVKDSFNGLEKFPDIDKCDLVVITHMFGQDFDLKGLAEFKEKTGALVIEDRVQGGTSNYRFSNKLMDISLYSMAMDKRPIALGGGYLYIRMRYQEIAEDLIEIITNYPPEPIRKRIIDLLKKIPTFLLYNKRGVAFLFLRVLRMLKLNLLDFTNMYRKKNPGFERNNFSLKPSKGLMKSMSQHYYDHQGMDKKYVKRFLKFMNRSNVCIIWNPTYKLFNFDYPGIEKHKKFHDGLIYLPSLANMSHEEIRYLADRIEKFDKIVLKSH